MQKLFEFLKGKKTYIVVLLGACVWASQQLGYIDQVAAEQLYALLGIAAVGTLRSAIK